MAARAIALIEKPNEALERASEVNSTPLVATTVKAVLPVFFATSEHGHRMNLCADLTGIQFVIQHQIYYLGLSSRYQLSRMLGGSLELVAHWYEGASTPSKLYLLRMHCLWILDKAGFVVSRISFINWKTGDITYRGKSYVVDEQKKRLPPEVTETMERAFPGSASTKRATAGRPRPVVAGFTRRQKPEEDSIEEAGVA